eukprot:CAMPEP_0175450532 /NCGR_PEP_ID=MMETSP0095-20121207/62419_1 /TAXON_ID=311494 /ORGANISM="Alexandrium monilatum, Strain CCMP3105" /LENGTH=85 /DNA_ID=CAMNT_0016751009 /DNA_START=11 /DNA_END=268 /DNA_ORIENTATION=-
MQAARGRATGSGGRPRGGGGGRSLAEVVPRGWGAVLQPQAGGLAGTRPGQGSGFSTNSYLHMKTPNGHMLDQSRRSFTSPTMSRT